MRRVKENVWEGKDKEMSCQEKMVKRPERKQKDRKKVTTEMMRAAVQAHEGADASRHNVMADWKVKAKTAADHRRDWEDLQGRWR